MYKGKELRKKLKLETQSVYVYVCIHILQV